MEFIEDFEEQMKNLEELFPGLRLSRDLQEEMIETFVSPPSPSGTRFYSLKGIELIYSKDSIPEIREDTPEAKGIKELINKVIVHAFIVYPSLQGDWSQSRDFYELFIVKGANLSKGKIIDFPIRSKYPKFCKNYLTYVSPREGEVFFSVVGYIKFLEKYKEYLPPSREFYKTLSMSEDKITLKMSNIRGEDLFEIFEDLAGEDPDKIRDLLFILLVLLETNNENLFSMRSIYLAEILEGIYREKGDTPLNLSNNTEALILKNVIEGLIEDYVDEHISFEDSLDRLLQGIKEVTLWKRIKTQSRRAFKKSKKRLARNK